MSGSSLPTRLIAWCVVTFVAITCSPLVAQQASSKTGKEDHTLSSARDKWPIHVTYYPSRLKENAAVVVLLHMKGGSRLVWTRKGGLAEALQNQGFAVIAADLRKHGQSKLVGVAAAAKKRGKKGSDSKLTRIDFAMMVTSDMEAIKKFISAEHQKKRLNMRKLAVVGAGMSSPVAVVFSANDWAKKRYNDAPTFAAKTPRGQDVRALVLLSPQGSLPGMTINRPMKYLKGKAAFLVCVGDRKSRIPLTDANRVYNFLKPISEDPEKRINWINTFPVQLQGTDLLGKRIGIEDVVVAFLKKYVGDLKDPWKDRRSRVNR
jgi:pimeloyl-ACP methyl ester carboxylesterase